MVSYDYEARRTDGTLVRGGMDAANLNSLKDALSRQGLFLETAKARSASGLTLKARKGSPLVSLLTFVREFRHLVAAGLPITQALSFLEDRGDDRMMADAVVTLREGVENGLPMDEAAAARPDVFDKLFQASVGAGLARTLSSLHLMIRHPVRSMRTTWSEHSTSNLQGRSSWLMS